MTDNKAGSMIEQAKQQVSVDDLQWYADYVRRMKTGGDAARFSKKDSRRADEIKRRLAAAAGDETGGRTVSNKDVASKNKGFQRMKGGGKVYTNHNKRYAHGGKVSGRKAKYNG